MDWQLRFEGQYARLLAACSAEICEVFNMA